MSTATENDSFGHLPADHDHDGGDDGRQEDETSEDAQRDDATCEQKLSVELQSFELTNRSND